MLSCLVTDHISINKSDIINIQFDKLQFGNKSPIHVFNTRDQLMLKLTQYIRELFKVNIAAPILWLVLSLMGLYKFIMT